MSETTPEPDDSVYRNPEQLIGYAMGATVGEELPEEELGVMVESPPTFDQHAFLQGLTDHTYLTVGVALSGISEADAEEMDQSAEKEMIRVTNELSDAIKWRNQKPGGFDWEGQEVPDRTVVLVRGDPAKLGSLHRLTGLSLGAIRGKIAELMKDRSEFSGNAPAESVWDGIESGFDRRLGIGAVAEYAATSLKDTDQASLEALGRELHVLGLFRDSNLLNDADAVDDRLEANAELVVRAKHLTNRDKRRLMNSIRKLDGDERQEQAERVEAIRRFQRTNDDQILGQLEFEEVDETLSTTSQRQSISSDDTGGEDEDDEGGSESSGGGGRRYTTRQDDAQVSVELAEEGEDEQLAEIAGEVDEEIEGAIEKEESSVEIAFDDDKRLRVDIDTDLYYFIEHFVGEDDFGGVIEAAEDRNHALENFQSLDQQLLQIRSEDSSFENLRNFASRNEEFTSVEEAVDSYAEQREKLIDALPGLLFCPLPRLVGDEDLLEAAESYLDAYRQAQDKLDKKFRSLKEASSKGAAKLLSEFLLLDTVVMETEEGRELVLSPLHPLHLWQSVEIAKEIVNERDNLDEAEWKFLRESVEEQPHVLKNISVGGRLLGSETYLIQSDEMGRLPVYTEAHRADPGSNEYLWDYLIEKFTAAYPPSKNHLKIGIVDPIEPVDLLKEIATAADIGSLHGATVEFAFIGRDQDDILSGATSAQEEDILAIFGPDSETDAFKILTQEWHSFEEYADHVAENPKHFVIVNDRSSFYLEEFERDLETSINPLYVPKEFNYDAFEDEINISASSEGRLFSEYQDLVNELHNQRQRMHQASIHELSTDRDTIQQLQDDAIWVCVSAPAMNTDPFWEENLVSRERRGDREYAVYSKDIGLFTRTLRRLLNEYPIAPDSTDVEEIANRIAGTERSGLLRLITEETLGAQKSKNTKGLLGSIIAVQWFEERFSDPKLLFSIDDPRTRRWLNFGDANRRADFIVVQPDGDEGLAIDIVEVKTYDDPTPAFTIENDDGQQVIHGDAVDQIVETTGTIRGLFTGEENVTTPPRREALREQLYYELVDDEVPGDKSEWVDRINNIFREDVQPTINPRVLSIEIANSDGKDEHLECESKDAQTILLDRLPRETIVRLIVNGMDDYEHEQTIEDEPTADTRESGEELSKEDAGTTRTSESGGSEELEEQTDDDEEQTTAVSGKEFGGDVDFDQRAEELKRTLAQFDIDIREIDSDKIEVGPNIIRYKVELMGGQKQDALERRSEDIAREMALEQEPFIHRLAGTPYVAVDVPRAETEIAPIEDYIDTLPTSDETTVGELPFVAGVTPAGEAYHADLNDAPHMLVGGTTGSGKTVFLYSVLGCLLDRQDIDDLKLALVDPKRTNFHIFNGLPNLQRGKVMTTGGEAFDLFEWIVEEGIPRRTEVLSSSASIDIEDHNERSDDQMTPLVVVVDEYADLVDELGDDSDQFQTYVRRIAQRARSVGIHLVIATQRPSANVIDTDLRANLDMRVAFRLPSANDSNVVLDQSGAEELGGNGDMLFKEAEDVTRLQGTLTEPEDIRDNISENT